MRKLKTRTLVVGNHAYVSIEDPMSGRRHVYTVYALDLRGQKEATVIGRELPLDTARQVIRKHVTADETARTKRFMRVW